MNAVPASFQGIKPIIGLAGGIGAGKSMVARILRDLGAGLVDSDEIGRALMSEAVVVETLRGWWGDTILDAEGRVDRRRLGDMVFGDAARRARLESLLHPRIAQERAGLVEQFQADPAVRAIVFDSPLLFETGLNRECDVVWFVEADPEVRARRVANARGWTPEELERREKLQKSLDFKRTQADDILVNHSDADELRLQVVRLFNRLLGRTPPVKP
ncbi:MAG: dephospho-CoA kinase [Planctomycetota bacterium]